jgi:ribosome-associated heat shock protein Hsp15
MDGVRVDKWLWAARFYKTRRAATEAVAGGKVQVNGERAKPAKVLRPGDGVRIRQGPYEFELAVRALAQRRGSAREAAALFDETAESRQRRERIALQMKLQALPVYEGKGRPTKKARRDIERLRGSDG